MSYAPNDSPLSRPAARREAALIAATILRARLGEGFDPGLFVALGSLGDDGDEDDLTRGQQRTMTLVNRAFTELIERLDRQSALPVTELIERLERQGAR